MAEPAASTAYGPMVIVAVEQTLPEAQRIIDDHLAYKMLPAYMKLMVKAANFKPLRQMLFNLMDKNMPGIRCTFVSRKRYMNEKILDALDAGIETVVILGAGLDTLAYRIPQLARVQVYEVDLPENIEYKSKQLQTIFGTIPAHVKLVSINFEKQNLEQVLAAHGYSFDQKTIFIWEAVTQYLSETAVRETFRVLSQATTGSRLVFTYVLKDFIDGKNTYGLDSLYQRFRIKEQHWFFGLHPQHVDEFLGNYGWKSLETMDGNDFTNRYLKPIGREETITVIEPAVYAEKL
jgi:methyltransferase (TIGR00027 family)